MTAPKPNTSIYIPQGGAELVFKATAAHAVTYTIGAEAANAINVVIQLSDADGVDLAVRSNVFMYLSDDANGDSIAATAPNTSVLIGTDGVIMPLIAGKAFRLTSEADGDIDVTITETGIDTWYMVIVDGWGRLHVSDAITFA